MVNDEKLLALRGLQQDGEPDLLDEVIRMFVEDSRARVAQAEAALAARDAEELRRLTHSLRGSAGMLGADAVADASKQIETAAATGDLDVAAPLVASLAHLLDGTVARLKEIQASLGSA
jgi:HPt (histidine-containing phosphotransfer) domain-containing protein